jgi:putative SOS response-associated peptidase YedK
LFEDELFALCSRAISIVLSQMCNLYTLRASTDQIAEAFSAVRPPSLNAGETEVYPGGRGMVVREQDGARIIQAMTWGFPMRLKTMKPESKPKPVNNIARIDAFPWKLIAASTDNRCIIPLTAFAEAEGPAGAKTRTWFTLKDRPIFAWAGMWRDSDEWGPVFSGLMTECNDFVAPVHDRMPVLLHEDEYDRWLHGSLNDVRALQDRCFPPDLMLMDRTPELWFKRKTPAAGAPLL